MMTKDQRKEFAFKKYDEIRKSAFAKYQEEYWKIDEEKE